MIILISKKINSYFKKNLINYINTNNYGILTCPNCGSNEYIRWGHYERNVIFFNEGGTCLESFILNIQRIKCKSCNKTHALLPFGIIPYKQFNDVVISEILFKALNTNVNEISTKYNIDCSLINKWIYQFKKFHFFRISTLLSKHDIKDTINSFFKNYEYKIKYIISNNFCFMQNKLGCLGTGPS